MQNNSINVVLYDAGMKSLASSFHSGNDYLDQFLRNPSALSESYGKTYVFLSSDGNTIIGYYNIGVGYIEQMFSYGRVRMGGSAHVNCFALDEKYHGLLQQQLPDGTKINLSDVLLDDCIRRIRHIRATEIGFSFITLCSTQQGISLYKRNAFEELDEDMAFSVEETDQDCVLMYLPLDYE